MKKRELFAIHRHRNMMQNYVHTCTQGNRWKGDRALPTVANYNSGLWFRSKRNLGVISLVGRACFV